MEEGDRGIDPLDKDWGYILSAEDAKNATPKHANKVVERRKRNNNKGISERN